MVVGALESRGLDQRFGMRDHLAEERLGLGVLDLALGQGLHPRQQHGRHAGLRLQQRYLLGRSLRGRHGAVCYDLHLPGYQADCRDDLHRRQRRDAVRAYRCAGQSGGAYQRVSGGDESQQVRALWQCGGEDQAEREHQRDRLCGACAGCGYPHRRSHPGLAAELLQTRQREQPSLAAPIGPRSSARRVSRGAGFANRPQFWRLKGVY